MLRLMLYPAKDFGTPRFVGVGSRFFSGPVLFGPIDLQIEVIVFLY